MRAAAGGRGRRRPATALEIVAADLARRRRLGRRPSPAAAYVLHVASPFPGAEPDHEDDLIVPAREGTLRVLRAARDAGVRRVVADLVLRGDRLRPRARPPTGSTPRPTGPTRTRRSAPTSSPRRWPSAPRGTSSRARATGWSSTVVNPVGIFGPVLGPDHSASIRMVQGLLRRVAMAAGTPRLCVRRRRRPRRRRPAPARDDRSGRRRRALHRRRRRQHLDRTTSRTILREHLGDAARLRPRGRAPRRGSPRRRGRPTRRMGSMLRELGNFRHLSNEKARRVLGWAPRSSEEAVLATAESLLRLGLLPSLGYSRGDTTQPEARGHRPARGA